MAFFNEFNFLGGPKAPPPGMSRGQDGGSGWGGPSGQGWGAPSEKWEENPGAGKWADHDKGGWPQSNAMMGGMKGKLAEKQLYSILTSKLPLRP